MLKATSLFAILTLLVLTGAGCGKQDTPSDADTITQKSEQQETTSLPGQIAYDYPIQAATKAKAGEYVLAIPREWVNTSFEDPAGSVFIYYAAKMVTPGTNESEIETLSGDKMVVPNSLIIPLTRGAAAKKGDILLTWHQSGSGMTRAIAVGGTPTEPEVLYLDNEFNPADAPEKLMPHSFTVLTSGDQVGATIACKGEGEQDFSRYQLVNSIDNKVLLLGWAGKMLVMKKTDCAALPIIPSVKTGDTVYFPQYGTFNLGTVTKVDHANGRVTVRYKFAGQDEEAMVPFGDIATQFVR